ncbi:AMP-binding protein [Rhodococcus sp. HNM0563]|uniref:AMP-binding protein n=1 Tax=unclassified Rhodococcus (in: high G+C Gram-positive bacteria) TaxID=192944 RepID=UPI00146DEF89|nr:MULTISPECIES: AMP-binding protein [unclassified Rhodococcus (in: high G+C Gram-positive bacteria)]MCK0089162.1 AMP-binding protein [Rhodococcus sp. F64268]NLU62706.1 AMP-binding protein [Rhodococcus sp. HNM0563]
MDTFAEVVRSRKGDEKIGLRFEDRQWTWDQVIQESADRAAALTAAVGEPADRRRHIGVLLENVPDFVFWIGAGALAGAVVVGINASRSGPEIADDIRQADVDFVITESRLAHLVDGTDHGLPADRIVDIDSPEYLRFLEPHRGADLPDTVPSPDDIALLLFSSGSTGRPKAVIVTQGRLGRLLDVLVERTQMRRDSVAYLCMPLFHGNAVMLNLGTAMRVGATVGLIRKFSASRFADDIHRYGATFVNYVGRALSYVLNKPEDPRDRTGTLEIAFGTEASEVDVARFSERFGCTVIEGYGSSEGVFRINRTPETPAGSLGVAPGGADVRILDENTGEECPRAQFDDAGRLLNSEAVGQIVAIGGAAAFEGYYKNPGAAAERVRDGDFWSGDLAYRDADGFFYFAGRASDWLRVDSENFSAAPVERILVRIPGILSAPVFAVPDPATGDQVMCAVELDAGAAFDPQVFGRTLAEQPDMGDKWWPRFVRVTDHLPLTGSNKIDKAPLRAAAWSTADPVYVRVGRTPEYVLLDDAGRTQIERDFTEQGRAALLPAPLASV